KTTTRAPRAAASATSARAFSREAARSRWIGAACTAATRRLTPNPAPCAGHPSAPPAVKLADRVPPVAATEELDRHLRAAHELDRALEVCGPAVAIRLGVT